MHKKYETHVSPERYKKCGDSQHVEGFRGLASKYQCKNCDKFGHFSSVCYKKGQFENKMSLEARRSPKATSTADWYSLHARFHIWPIR